MLPAALRIFFGEPPHELKGSFHHAIRFGNVDLIAEVLARGCFETDVATAMFTYRILAATDREPLVCVVNLNRMQSVAIDPIEQLLVMTHQPDHQLAERSNSRVDRRVLYIGR